jgi:flavorubredoxin
MNGAQPGPSQGPSQPDRALPAGAEVAVFDVVPGVQALAGALRLDGRVPWVPPRDRGWEASLAYLVREGSHFLLVDTGMTVHAAGLAATLNDLLPPDASLSVLVTRIELDAVGNVGTLLERVRTPVQQITGFAVDPVEFFFSSADPESPLPVRCPFRLTELGSELDTLPGRPVSLLPGPLGNLLTCWPYDARTGTLFTSDSFGWVHGGRPGDVPVLDRLPRDLDASVVREHLLARFDWIAEADGPSVVRALDGIFAEREVRAIAPAHGAVLRGAATVAAAHELMREALLGVATGAAAG